ncbi:MAG: AAA family ATPase, partial [Desulfobacterales bacterium]
MGMLENIQTGRENKPPRIMIYGSEGVGKSTFGASAPNAIFVQTEDGLGEINCKKFPLAHSLSEVITELIALRDEPHDFQTVVIDSADWLERLIFDEVCREFG